MQLQSTPFTPLAPYHFFEHLIDVYQDANEVLWWRAQQIGYHLGARGKAYGALLNVVPPQHRQDVDSTVLPEYQAHGTVTLISEYGLMRLVMASQKKGAIPFQQWVLYEVLPPLLAQSIYKRSARTYTPMHLLRDVEQMQGLTTLLSTHLKRTQEALIDMLVRPDVESDDDLDDPEAEEDDTHAEEVLSPFAVDTPTGVGVYKSIDEFLTERNLPQPKDRTRKRKRCVDLSHMYNIPIVRVPSEKYGTVNGFDENILQAVFL